MILSTLRLALRNLGRNVRRTLLSVVGIGIGCAIAVTLTGMRQSITEVYSRMAAETGPGHLRITPSGWLPRRDDKLRLVGGPAALRRVRAMPGVRVAAPRARMQGLLAMGTRVAGVELTGVDPLAEPRALRFVRQVVKGRYLQAGDGDAVVIGKVLAERLSVDVDDDLVVTAMATGGTLQSAMLRIVGIVTSKSREIDSGLAQVPLATVQRLSGIPGIGEIAVLLDDFDHTEALRPAVLQAAGANTVLRWSEVNAQLATHLKQDEAAGSVMSGIVLIVVLLGVAAAQLTAVLERRREFAVFAAIGMKPRRLVLQILLESTALGLLGALASLCLAAPGLWYLASHGLDLRAMIGDYTVEGVMVDPVFYARIDWWMLPYIVRLALLASLLGAIYPAIYAARTDPATALRSAA